MGAVDESDEIVQPWAADDNRLAAVLANSSDIVTILDAEGRVLYASPATTRILGYRAGTVGISLLDIVHPDDRERVRQALIVGVASDSRAGVTLEVRVARADGRWCHLEAVATNHLDDPAVRGIIVNSRDVTDRVHMIDELRHAAYHDSLTGLPNRALLLDRMEQALARSSRSGLDLAVFYLDLDGFKAVNDRYGHAEGDAVLREVASRVLSVIRPADTAARMGGDELVVMAEGLSLPSEAVSLAERIIDTVGRPFAGVNVAVTISVGIGLGSGVPAGELLERADRALYQAKHKGGGWWIEPGQTTEITRAAPGR